MSDPLDPLTKQQGGSPSLLKRNTEIDLSRSFSDQEIIAGGAGLLAGTLLTGRFHAAAHIIFTGTFLKVPPLSGVPRPHLLLGLLFYAPPPLGFGKAEFFGLHKNYVRNFLESDLGVPSDLIPSTHILATEKSTPEIEADFHRVLSERVTFNYERHAINLSFDQLRSDYSLFTRAARGELGPVPPNLRPAELAAVAIEAYNAKLAHLAGDVDSFVASTAIPPLVPVPPLPTVTAAGGLVVIPPAAAVNPLRPQGDVPAIASGAGDGGDQLPQPVTSGAQFTSTQAPRFLRGLASGRRDP